MSSKDSYINKLVEEVVHKCVDDIEKNIHEQIVNDDISLEKGFQSKNLKSLENEAKKSAFSKISDIIQEYQDLSKHVHATETTDQPPAIDFYSDTLPKKKKRHSINTLMTPFSNDPRQLEDGLDFGKSGSDDPTDKLGWIEGVFLRCVSNIFGIILYARLGWIAGQAGLLYGSAIILLGFVVVMITAFSTSAICTNGIVKGGGSYYFISRSLGPNLGGSVGLIYVAANVVRAAMYVVGIGESLRDLLKESGYYVIDGGMNDIRLYCIISTIILLSIVRMGTVFESKIQVILVIMITMSVIDFVLGPFFPLTDYQKVRGMTGFSIATMTENLLPDYREYYDFITIFAIYFPATTGIMAGANISGDLKNPGDAIPKGTILAIITTTLTYLGVLWISGSTVVRDADGHHIPMLKENALLSDMVKKYEAPTCLGNYTCNYGLNNYYQSVELESLWGPVITMGLLACTLSSALNSFVSAPKIFQAICKDKIFPYVSIFGKGYGKNAEPYVGYLMMFFLTLGISLIGDLNIVAPLITNFYLCAFALTNFTCFHVSFSGSPGFRPTFKFYNKWCSLFGALVCIAIMFLISWYMALITSSLFWAIWIYLNRRKPNVNWGTSSEAQNYKMAIQNIVKLNWASEHVKNYRPQILVLSGNPTDREILVKMASSVTKGNSLLVCGHVVSLKSTQDSRSITKEHEDFVYNWLKQNNFKAFYTNLIDTNVRNGSLTLQQTCGVGKLKPNIVLVGYKSNWMSNPQDFSNDDYVGLIRDSFANRLAFGIFRDGNHGFEHKALLKQQKKQTKEKHIYPEDPQRKFTSIFTKIIKTHLKKSKDIFSVQPEEVKVQEESPKSATKTIDVWWLSDDGGLTLLIPYLLSQRKSFLEKTKLRIFTTTNAQDCLQEQINFENLLQKFRIPTSEVKVISNYDQATKLESLTKFEKIVHTLQSANPPLIQEEELKSHMYSTLKYLRLAELLQEHSANAEMTLPIPKQNISNNLYMLYLEIISRDLPPILMLRGNQTSVLTYYS